MPLTAEVVVTARRLWPARQLPDPSGDEAAAADAAAPVAAGSSAVVEVHDPVVWNRVAERMRGTFFTQSWEWGEASRDRGWEPHRLLWPSRSRPEVAGGAMQVLVRRIPVLGWGIAYAPRGPLSTVASELEAGLPPEIQRWGRRHRVGTLVVDPAVAAESRIGQALQAEPWRPAPTVGEARVHIVDLAGSDLWARLRPKYRQQIRRAENAGLEVRWTDPATPPAEAAVALAQFGQVYGDIASRLRLAYDPLFTRRVWEVFSSAGRAQIATATLGDVPLASLLLLTFGDEMVGFAGGQASIGAPHGAGKLVQWRAIQCAQELGLERYNMWGTATDTLAYYKEGFGAREERYVGAHSLALREGPDRMIRSAWHAQQVARRLRRHAPP